MINRVCGRPRARATRGNFAQIVPAPLHRRSRGKVSVVFDRVSRGRSYSAETRSHALMHRRQRRRRRHRAPGPAIRNVGKVRVKGCCSPVEHAHAEGRPVPRRPSEFDTRKFSPIFMVQLCYSFYRLPRRFQSFYLLERKDHKSLPCEQMCS